MGKKRELPEDVKIVATTISQGVHLAYSAHTTASASVGYRCCYSCCDSRNVQAGFELYTCSPAVCYNAELYYSTTVVQQQQSGQFRLPATMLRLWPYHSALTLGQPFGEA
ncbi:hypothetical protein V1478_000200 [Vespula squamosa]|uniref:Uncharacterized protein n=1 Tax=Vespula squamosa TaxID=30214 RepID=A0ABD2C4X2_VESSQ